MSKKVCKDCGNNPVPHSLLFIAQTVVFLGGILAKKEQPKFTALSQFISKLFELSGISSWRSEHTTASQRTRVILCAAKKLNIPVQQEYIFGNSTEVFRFTKNNQKLEFYSLPERHSDSQVILKKLDNKWSTKKLLQSIHTQTPKGVLLKTKKDLEKCKQLTYPLVIKPAQGSRGRHTHMQIKNYTQLIAAYENAKKICFFVLCEEQYTGSVHRFTTVNNKVAGVLRGDYPTVTGTGKSTIQQLIQKKNETLPKEITEIQPDIELLSRQGLDLSSILDHEQNAMLGSKIGIRYGGDAVEISAYVHKSFIKEIERVAKELNIFILGFDVIAENAEKDATTQKWAIIEINTIPFIDLHHYPRAGKAVDVASIIWREIYTS